MRAGKLDRRVRILQRVDSRDAAYNTAVANWVEVATVWGEVQDQLPSRGERIAEGVNVARRPCRVRMRWRDDIEAGMRLEVEGRTLRIITMPAELGRREGIELIAEELTTGGQEP